MSPLAATVVVCTRNRAALLPDALASLARQQMPRERFEVIVVDNASTDGTAEVVATWGRAADVSLRRVREETLGLNPARNRGIAEGAGEVVAFLDDDARAHPGWLAALLDAFAATPAEVVGGKIVPLWESPPPAWLHPGLRPLLALLDLGDDRRVVEDYPFLFGTNLAVRAEAFRRHGTFHPRLDRQGADLLSAGDTELCHRVHRGGGMLLYEPRAVVEHRIPAERLRASFFLRRSYSQGRSVCRLRALDGAFPRRPSRPLALVKVLGRLPGPILRRDPAGTMRALTTVAWHIGYLREARRSRFP